MTATVAENGGAGDVKAKTAMVVDDQDKIAAQVEYYFSDANLRKDKFLKEKIAEKEGWVDLNVLMSFNRLKAMASSEEVVREAIKNISLTNEDTILELDDTQMAVRRKSPLTDLTEEEQNALNDRTIHFKGITSDATIDEIRVFCEQYGKVESVEMRRKREDRSFKGCVMCVYATQEDANRAMEGKEAYDPEITFLRENKTRYFARKKEWYESKKNKKNRRNVDGDNKVDETEDTDPVKVKDAILVLSEMDTKATQYSAIKEFFKSFGDVKYVEMAEETCQAFVRFSASEEASLALSSGSDGEEGKKQVTIGEKTYPVSLVSGEEEVSFWKRVNSAFRNAIPRDKHAHRSKGRGFKRGGGGYKGSDRRTKQEEGSGHKRTLESVAEGDNKKPKQETA